MCCDVKNSSKNGTQIVTHRLLLSLIYCVLQALVPRPEVGVALLRHKRRVKDTSAAYCISGVKMQGLNDPAVFVAAFKVSNVMFFQRL